MTAPDPRLGEIAGRLSKATPGPWEARGLAYNTTVGKVGEYRNLARLGDPLDKEAWRNAEFIANAPTDVAYLLAELRKAQDVHEREMAELIKERDDMEQMCDELARRIAPPHVLGEHSSDNDPWLNALNYGDSTDWGNASKDEVEANEEAALAEAAALSDLRKAQDALGRVEGLHFAAGDPDHSYADICFECCDTYPCSTIDAIRAAVAAATGGGE